MVSFLDIFFVDNYDVFVDVGIFVDDGLVDSGVGIYVSGNFFLGFEGVLFWWRFVEIIVYY